MGSPMWKKNRQSNAGSPGEGGSRSVDYGAWVGAIKRIGPGLLQYFRKKHINCTEHDIYDGMMDAIRSINNVNPLFNPDDKQTDPYFFASAKNATVNILKKRREQRLIVEPHVFHVFGLDDADTTEPTEIKQDLIEVLLSLSEDKRIYILNYSESDAIKTPAERQKAQRIRDEIEKRMHQKGYDSFGRKRIAGDGQ
jgi:hypothetical protein